MKALFLLGVLASTGVAQLPVQNSRPSSLATRRPSHQTTTMHSLMDSLTGKTIIWTCDDGPMAGVKIEHTFGADGSVTWTIADGPHKGASVREKKYGAVKVSEKVWMISYLAASGHTLTVALNVDDGRMVAFGSNSTSWEGPIHGRFSMAP